MTQTLGNPIGLLATTRWRQRRLAVVAAVGLSLGSLLVMPSLVQPFVSNQALSGEQGIARAMAGPTARDRMKSLLLILDLSALSCAAVLTLNLGLGAIRHHRRLRQIAERASWRAELAVQNLEAVVDAVPAAISAYDRAGRRLFANQEHAALFGTEAAVPDGLIGAVFGTGKPVPFHERQAATDDGDGPKTLLTTLVPVTGNAGQVERVVSVSMDISTRKRTEERFRHLAHHDALTGLPNRAHFRAVLDELAVPVQGMRPAAAVFLIDMDHFKQINDTFGHAAGDAALRAVAERLKAGLSERDLVARLGGDEFAVICPELSPCAALAELADRLLTRVTAPFSHEDVRLELSLSIGIACWPSDGRDAETLLRHADLALYEVKSSGRNGWRRFERAMYRDLEERRALADLLRQPPASVGFALAYQPSFRLSDGALVGIEALLRWEHPEKGLIPPTKAVALAEEVDAIDRLGAWVLDEACAATHQLQACDGPQITVAVNVSPLQFRCLDFVDNVLDTVRRANLPPGSLILEVTESLLIRDPRAAALALERLHQGGVHIALDNFGTGYIGLGYLHRFSFRFDMVKLDRSYTRDLTTNATSRTIVRAAIAMAHSLDLRVVAEGVETEAQQALLKDYGCDIAQGFLFSPAADLGQVIGHIHRQPQQASRVA